MKPRPRNSWHFVAELLSQGVARLLSVYLTLNLDLYLLYLRTELWSVVVEAVEEEQNSAVAYPFPVAGVVEAEDSMSPPA